MVGPPKREGERERVRERLDEILLRTFSLSLSSHLAASLLVLHSGGVLFPGPFFLTAVL